MAAPRRIPVPREVRGRRVVLRPLRSSDVRAVWEAIDESRHRLERWLPWVQATRSLDDQRAAMVRLRDLWRRRKSFVVGIFDRRTGRYLGGSGLHRINWETRSFEIGYWIRTSAEGRGYVSETVRLLTRLVFDRLGASRVEIFMDPRNTRSRAVPERLGFVLEGTLRRKVVGTDGRLEDRCVFAVTRDDYERLPWRTRRVPESRR
jgi:RimJ/RimL family protein N-acetyltransferase